MVVCELRDKPLILLHLLRQHSLRRALCFTASVEETHRYRAPVVLPHLPHRPPVSCEWVAVAGPL